MGSLVCLRILIVFFSTCNEDANHCCNHIAAQSLLDGSTVAKTDDVAKAVFQLRIAEAKKKWVTGHVSIARVL